jgi:hypothetical protein
MKVIKLVHHKSCINIGSQRMYFEVYLSFEELIERLTTRASQEKLRKEEDQDRALRLEQFQALLLKDKERIKSEEQKRGKRKKK